MTGMDSVSIRHTLATLAYRTARAIEDAVDAAAARLAPRLAAE